MGLKLERKKDRNWLLTLLYRLDKIIPLSNKRKLKFYGDLEWVANRLVMEKSFIHYPNEQHPFRADSYKFLSKYISKDKRILDLGCHRGDITYPLSKLCKEIIGIDYNEDHISRAKEKYQADNLKFINAEALTYLQSNTKKFDVLILSHILEHLDNPSEFLSKFKGFFDNIYIEVPDYHATYHNQYRKDLGSNLTYTDDDHVSEFDREELEEMLSQLNVSIVESDYRFAIQKLWCKVN